MSVTSLCGHQLHGPRKAHFGCHRREKEICFITNASLLFIFSGKGGSYPSWLGGPRGTFVVLGFELGQPSALYYLCPARNCLSKQ